MIFDVGAPEGVGGVKPAGILPHIHGKCGKRWGGFNTCHCGGCHETFTGITAFDAHRVGGVCSWPVKVGLVLNARGYWASPAAEVDWREVELPPTESALARAWAVENGFDVAAKGRVPVAVLNAYRESCG